MKKDIIQFKKNATERIGYAHSANALFHFMRKREFLENAIKQCVLYPRYFLEDLSYRKLKDGDGVLYSEAAVLGICFCDIPLTRIAIEEKIEILNDKGVNVQERKSHSDLYGEYAIGFSKSWCEKQEVRPVHYYNPLADHKYYLSEAFEVLVKEEEVPDSFSKYILDDIGLGKPLRGVMERTEVLDGKEQKKRMLKNFHDEQEWRFIPTQDMCDILTQKLKSTIRPIIANPSLLEIFNREGNFFTDLSNRIANAKEKKTGLSFKRKEIKYLIVPDEAAKAELISYLNSLYEKRKVKADLFHLISCIHVLSDVKRDY